MNLLEIDEELDFLEISLHAIEPIFNKTNSEITELIFKKENVLSAGLCERSEFIAGLAFTICQKYITGTLGWIKIEKNLALRIGPKFSANLSFAQIINSAANYWKHKDEWDTVSFAQADDNLSSVIARDSELLSNQAKRTIETLKQVTDWSDYTCVNTLYKITKNDKTNDYSLLPLIPLLQRWRSNLLEFYMNQEKSSINKV